MISYGAGVDPGEDPWSSLVNGIDTFGTDEDQDVLRLPPMPTGKHAENHFLTLVSPHQDQDPKQQEQSITQETACHEIAFPMDLACPYAVYDPQRYSASNSQEPNYRRCGLCHLPNIRRLKEHLRRVHRRPSHYCERCHTTFDSRKLQKEHVLSESGCEARECPFNEKMTQEQCSSVMRRRTGGSINVWYEIYEVLFPGATLPASAFAETATSIKFSGNSALNFPSKLKEKLDKSRGLSPSAQAYVMLLAKNAWHETVLNAIDNGEILDPSNHFEQAFAGKQTHEDQLLITPTTLDDSPGDLHAHTKSIAAGSSRRPSEEAEQIAVSNRDEKPKILSGAYHNLPMLKELDSQVQLGALKHNEDQNLSIVAEIKRFYAICKNGIKFAKAVHTHCPNNEGTSSPNGTSTTHNLWSQNCSTEPCFKRKREDDDTSLPVDNVDHNTPAVPKRAKGNGNLSDEFPCWWFMMDPKRYHTCANNCSRNRDLHSYRRHHFDEHWKWGDVEAEGISFESWDAAKHAIGSRTKVTADERDRMKWILTFKILFGLSEVDAVPDPSCYEANHVHHKARRPLKTPLPVKKFACEASPSCDADPSSVNATSMAGPSSSMSFLDPTTGPSLFQTFDMTTLGDPNNDGFNTAWDSRPCTANDLLRSHSSTDDLKTLVSDHIARIQILLDSMIYDPDQISCATIRQICNYAIDFETSYNQVVLHSYSSIESTSQIPGVPSWSSLVPIPPSRAEQSPFQIASVTGAFPSPPRSGSESKSGSQMGDSVDDQAQVPGTPSNDATPAKLLNVMNEHDKVKNSIRCNVGVAQDSDSLWVVDDLDENERLRSEYGVSLL